MWARASPPLSDPSHLERASFPPRMHCRRSLQPRTVSRWYRLLLVCQGGERPAATFDRCMVFSSCLSFYLPPLAPLVPSGSDWVIKEQEVGPFSSPGVFISALMVPNSLRSNHLTLHHYSRLYFSFFLIFHHAIYKEITFYLLNNTFMLDGDIFNSVAWNKHENKSTPVHKHLIRF